MNPPIKYPDFAHRCWRFLFRAGVPLTVGDLAAGVGAHPTRVTRAVETLLLHQLVTVKLEGATALLSPRPYRDDDREQLRVRLINRIRA